LLLPAYADVLPLPLPPRIIGRFRRFAKRAVHVAAFLPPPRHCAFIDGCRDASARACRCRDALCATQRQDFTRCHAPRSEPAVYYADTDFRSPFSPLIFDVIFAMTLPPLAPVIYACWLPIAAPRRALRRHCLPAFAASRFSPAAEAGYAAASDAFDYCRATLLVAIICQLIFAAATISFSLLPPPCCHFAFAFLSRMPG
jgi:hypothetical protein